MFAFDPNWRSSTNRRLKFSARKAWENHFSTFSGFIQRCKDQDFQHIVLEQSGDLTTINQQRLGLHCMKVVMDTRDQGKVYCTNRMAEGQAFCPEHLTTTVGNHRLAVFEKVAKIVNKESVFKFMFGRNVTISVPKPDAEEFQFHALNMLGTEDTFAAETKTLIELIKKCNRFYRRHDDAAKINEMAFRLTYGSPAPFKSWSIFYAVLKENVVLFGFSLDEDWCQIINRMTPLVATQGWTRVSKTFLTPYGENSEKFNINIKPHEQSASCYNATAAHEGRMIIEVDGLKMHPKRSVIQQQLPLYLVETDLLDKVKEFDAVAYIAFASRIMYLDYRNTNAGLADSVLRNDGSNNQGKK